MEDDLQLKPLSDDELREIMAELKTEEDLERLLMQAVISFLRSFDKEKILKIVVERFAAIVQSFDWADWGDGEEAAPAKGLAQEESLALEAPARENSSSGTLQEQGGTKSGSWSSSSENRDDSNNGEINRSERAPTTGSTKAESRASVSPAREGRSSGHFPGRRGEPTGLLASSRGQRGYPAPRGRSGPSRDRQGNGPMIDNEWADRGVKPEEKQVRVEDFDKAHMKPRKATDLWK